MAGTLAARKLDHLRDLAAFATDAAHRLLIELGYPEADTLSRLARAVVEGAAGSTDQAAFMNSYNALPDPDRDGLNVLLDRTSLLWSPDLPADPVVALDDALTLHWPRSFGFRDKAEAKAALPAEDVERLDSFTSARADAFWPADALAAQLGAETLSLADMRLAATYGLTAGDGSILNDVKSFADIERLRQELESGKPGLSGQAAARLEQGLNAHLKELRDDWGPVSVAGLLA